MLVASCTGSASGKERAGAPPLTSAPAAQHYAFADDSHLMIATGDRIVHRIPAANVAGIDWTHDGRYVFALDRPLTGDGADQIIAADVATGETVTRRCDCISAAAVGPSDILFIDRQGRANRLDLSDRSSKAEPASFTMPAGLVARQVFDGAGDVLPLLATASADFDNTSGALYEYTAAGTARLLRDLPQVYDLSMIVARETSSGVQYLYSAIEVQGDCAHPGPVFLTDPVTRESVPTDVTVIREGPAGNGTDVGLSDAWWGADGSLYGRLQSWICSPEGGTPVTPAQVFKLAGNRWVTHDPQALTFRDLRSGERLVVSTDSTLYLETGGTRARIAEDVTLVEPQPPAGR
ncbi:hypothetical protein Ait01nite_015400 [Actinoplanes italicus]|uniref:WD40 repeat protein n=1 Tax=Actinoplanes italicus TaxID=113567 RepID=A0A2T0KHR0_9ACTN|nr:hypothetical protein CLV67_104502 [Actinoplanes italicus]GIE28495.1 hypothetical protein Ait01nite_015400 [Actinoplanes italicus]